MLKPCPPFAAMWARDAAALVWFDPTCYIRQVPFGLFRRSPRAERDVDRVWLTHEAKLWGVLAVSDARIVVHFAETRRALQSLAHREGATVEIALAEELVRPPQPDPTLVVVVAERHPLREHDQRVVAWADSAAGRIAFHVSLEDPLLALFVGDSLRAMLDQLGLTPGTPLQSALVSRSIEKAQARVASRAQADVPSDSAAGWLQANGIGAP